MNELHQPTVLRQAPVVRHAPGDGPLRDLLWDIAPGTRVLLQPGKYRGPLIIRHDVELLADGPLGSVTIQAGRGTALSIEGARSVVLRRLMLQGPKRGLGAVLTMYDKADLTLEDCLITGGRGVGEGGGGLDIQQGKVDAVRCRLTNNVALQGGAVRGGGPVLLRFFDCVMASNRVEGLGGGAVFTTRGGRAELVNCTFTGNSGEHGSALLAGRGGAGGSIEAVNCLFGKDQLGLSIAVHGAGKLSLRHCVVPAIAGVVSEGVEIGAGVVEKAVPLRTDEPRFAAMFSTQLVALGDALALAQSRTDVYGRPRGSVIVGAVA